MSGIGQKALLGSRSQTQRIKQLIKPGEHRADFAGRVFDVKCAQVAW
ncbi:hypothetical protein [Nitrosomonas sp.]